MTQLPKDLVLGYKAAEQLTPGISAEHLRLLAHQGKLPITRVRVGNMVAFSQAELEQFAAEYAAKPRRTRKAASAPTPTK